MKTSSFSTLTGITIFVAASDAPECIKAHADYVCSGNGDDDVVIGQAVAELPRNGGTIKLSEGNFHLRDFQCMFHTIPDCVQLVGSSIGQEIQLMVKTQQESEESN